MYKQGGTTIKTFFTKEGADMFCSEKIIEHGKMARDQRHSSGHARLHYSVARSGKLFRRWAVIES
jgi:hypothetical protein